MGQNTLQQLKQVGRIGIVLMSQESIQAMADEATAAIAPITGCERALAVVFNEANSKIEHVAQIPKSSSDTDGESFDDAAFLDSLFKGVEFSMENWNIPAVDIACS